MTRVKDHVMICDDCGAERELPRPVTLDLFELLYALWREAHEDCAELAA